jgi:hypothetical protein
VSWPQEGEVVSVATSANTGKIRDFFIRSLAGWFHHGRRNIKPFKKDVLTVSGFAEKERPFCHDHREFVSF